MFVKKKQLQKLCLFLLLIHWITLSIRPVWPPTLCSLLPVVIRSYLSYLILFPVAKTNNEFFILLLRLLLLTEIKTRHTTPPPPPELLAVIIVLVALQVLPKKAAEFGWFVKHFYRKEKWLKTNLNHILKVNYFRPLTRVKHQPLLLPETSE